MQELCRTKVIGVPHSGPPAVAAPFTHAFGDNAGKNLNLYVKRQRGSECDLVQPVEAAVSENWRKLNLSLVPGRGQGKL